MDRYSSVPTSEKSSAEGLLEKNGRSSIDSSVEEGFDMKYKHPSWYRRNERPLLLGTIILLINMIICVVYTHWLTSQYAHFPPTSSSPAKDIMGYEGREWDLVHIYLGNGTMNPQKKGNFNGPPTPELAEEWHGLLQYQNMRLQKEDLGPFGNDDNLVELSDKSGYMGTLAVYHGLHCLKRFHHYLYREEYYPDMSIDDQRRLLFHAEHCIDWLRQYVQCNADTTVIPYYWGDNQGSPLATDKAQHQCLVWSPFEQWSRERSFDAFAPGMLVHPKFGKLFGDDYKGDPLGIVSENYPLAGKHGSDEHEGHIA